METYRNFRICKTENEEYIISFAVGVRKRNMRVCSAFKNIEDAKKEIDFRFLSLRNEGRFYNGNATVNFDVFADYEIDSTEHKAICENIGITNIKEYNEITLTNMNKTKTIDYNAIQKEIDKNYIDLKSGDYDVYNFCGDISKKYFKPVDPIWGERSTHNNPYLNMLFGMLEINGIELY